jgi:hypothetical protein
MAFPTPTHPGDMSVAIALPNPLLADNAEAFYDCVLSGGEEARAELDCSSAALLAIQPLPVRSIQEIAAIPDPDERARELYFSNPDLDCPTVQALIASLVKTFHGAVLAQRLLPPPPKRVVRRRKRRVPPPPVQMPSLFTAFGDEG